MKVKEAIEKLSELKTPDVELLLALPGNRFSPATLVEPFKAADEQGDNQRSVVIIYPHPRDVSAPAAPGTGATKSEFVQMVDTVMDFFGGKDDDKQ